MSFSNMIYTISQCVYIITLSFLYGSYKKRSRHSITWILGIPISLCLQMGVDGVVIKSRPSKFGVVCYFDVIFPFINTNKNNNYS